ncbi:MAG TPA: hypothetical protein VI037_01280 [Nitrososphaera sp.]
MTGASREQEKLFAARMAWRLLCAVPVFKKYTFLSCGVEEAVTGYNPWDLEAVAHRIISYSRLDFKAARLHGKFTLVHYVIKASLHHISSFFFFIEAGKQGSTYIKGSGFFLDDRRRR